MFFQPTGLIQSDASATSYLCVPRCIWLLIRPRMCHQFCWVSKFKRICETDSHDSDGDYGGFRCVNWNKFPTRQHDTLSGNFDNSLHIARVALWWHFGHLSDRVCFRESRVFDACDEGFLPGQLKFVVGSRIDRHLRQLINECKLVTDMWTNARTYWYIRITRMMRKNGFTLTDNPVCQVKILRRHLCQRNVIGNSGWSLVPNANN